MSQADGRSTGSIFSNARGALARFAGGLWSRYGGFGWSRVRLLLPGAKFDWEREAGDPWMNSVVAVCLAWIGDRVARPRMKVSRVGRRGDLIEVPRHGLADLWARPNPFYGRRTLEKALALSLKVDGNAYIYKVRDNGGRVCQLWWIPHFRILPTWPADGSSYIDGYRVWIDSGTWDLPPEDVLHIRDGIDPRNERLGISALKANLREVCAINYESSYTAALLKNSGVPALAVVPDGDERGPSTRDEADRMAERFLDGHSGDDVGRPIIMGGRYKIVEVGFSPEKLVLDKLPQAAQARIAASIGVAAMSAGLPDAGKTYSNLGEANRTSWGTIVALQELIAETAGNDLIRESIQVDGRVTPAADAREYRVEYDYSQIQELQESLDALHKRTRDDFLADAITRNEFRDETGREPDPDGDRFYSQIKADSAPAPGPGPADGEPDGDEEDPADVEDATDTAGAKSWRY